MSTNIQFTSIPSKRLSASINASSTTIQLGDILGWNGTALTSADLGDKLYAVLRNDSNTLMEIMELDPTTIASASITILKRGLKFNGDLTTEVTANKLTWVKNETIVELGSHPPQLLNYTVRTYGAQTINDVKTFVDFPVKSGSTTPTQSTEFATKAYTDAVAGGSAVYDQNVITGTAGETLVSGDVVYFKESDQRWWKTDADAAATAIAVKIGVSQAAASAAGAATILIGGLVKNLSGLSAGTRYYVSGTAGALSATPGAFRRFIGTAVSTTTLLFNADSDVTNIKQDGREIYAADGGASDSYAITLSPVPTTLTTGMVINFKANTANTGAATLAVNSISAVTIKKNHDQDLDDNDIEVGQVVTVVYDGTYFQMQSQTGNKPAINKFGGTGADGALSITSGTTTTSIASAAVLIKNYSSISITGTGAQAFSNPATNGSIVIFKSSGDVTITTSANPAIDLRSLGATGGAGGAAAGTQGAASAGGGASAINDGVDGSNSSSAGNQNAGTNGTDALGFLRAKGGIAPIANSSTGGGKGVSYGGVSTLMPYSKALNLTPGAGGGGGGGGPTSGTGGTGGRGAGAFYIECNGALNITSVINAAGANGSNAAGDGGGGGGGAGGVIIILYRSLTANSGTYTVTGGSGGSGFGGGTGGAGGAGYSLVAQNTEWAM